MNNHTTVEVRAFPTCDLHATHVAGPEPKMVPAHYDGATTFGPWANMCDDCFAQYGRGLGTGRGQELVLADPRRETQRIIDRTPRR